MYPLEQLALDWRSAGCKLCATSFGGLRMDSARKLRFVLCWTLLTASAPGLMAAEVAEKLSLRPTHRSGEQSHVEIALQVG